MKPFLYILFGCLFSSACFSQDTLKVMQYNLMYYGKNTSFCTNINNNLDHKDSSLRKILNFVQPDVFCVNEMGSEDSLASRILERDLNINGKNFYKRAGFTMASGSLIANMLFYNSNKLTLYRQQVIANDTSGNPLIRVIDLYTLYYNDKYLNRDHDTVFITFCVAHLKAGSTSADQLQRDQETSALMKFIKNKPGNYLFSGDFNLQSSSEASYQNLTNSSDFSIRFYDPVNQPGDWNNNPDFTIYHSQATHTTGSCFSGSGLDDRFDFILASAFVMNDSAKVKYIDGSYKTIGQDGNHLDMAVNENINTSVPIEVSDALYNMSDHLPVSLQLKLNVSPAEKSNSNLAGENNVYITNPVENSLLVKLYHEPLETKVYIQLYSILGKVIFEKELTFKGSFYELNENLFFISRGLYILKISDKQTFSITRKILKN